MDSRTIKVFLVCALGAFIGTLVALQVNENFWWLGTIAGFGVGYLGYDFKQAVQAVPKAWFKVVSYRPHPVTWYCWRHFAPPAFLAVASLITTLKIAMIGIAFVIHWLALEGPFTVDITAMLAIAVACSAGAALMFTIHVINLSGSEFVPPSLLEERNNMLIISKHLNPLSLYGFWIWVAVYYLIITLFRGIVRGTVTVGRFIKTFFILVHSDERLLCGIDAAIGATTGFVFGHALIGALIGGFVGVINFELISKRWLKCVPSANR